MILRTSMWWWDKLVHKASYFTIDGQRVRDRGGPSDKVQLPKVQPSLLYFLQLGPTS